MFKEKLKKLRKKHGYTQEYMANQLNISRPTYTNYERGEREPDYQMLRQIAIFFDVSTDYLLDVSDEPTPLRETSNNKPVREMLDATPPNENIIDISGLSDESKKYLQSQVKIAERLDRAEENSAVNAALGFNPKTV